MDDSDLAAPPLPQGLPPQLGSPHGVSPLSFGAAPYAMPPDRIPLTRNFLNLPPQPPRQNVDILTLNLQVPVTVPQLPPLVSAEQLDLCALQLAKMFPSVDFSADGRKDREEFIGRIDGQAIRAQAKLAADLRCWGLRKDECLLLKNWDQFAADIERESKIVAGVTRSGKRKRVKKTQKKRVQKKKSFIVADESDDDGTDGDHVLPPLVNERPDLS